MSEYVVTLLPAIRPDETEWLVTGGREPYTVRRNMTKSHAGRRNLVRRSGGCKHCKAVIDSLNVDAMLEAV